MALSQNLLAVICVMVYYGYTGDYFAVAAATNERYHLFTHHWKLSRYQCPLESVADRFKSLRVDRVWLSALVTTFTPVPSVRVKGILWRADEECI
jgi:hypothetical protein